MRLHCKTLWPRPARERRSDRHDRITAVKLRREARLLKDKALASLRRAAGAFNDFDDVGRTSTVLLHLQHAFEMLLKAALVQRNMKVFEKRDGRSIGHARCVNLGPQHLGLSESEAGVLRAVDALRDDEQHWLTECSEGLLYLHTRAAVTLFDDLLQRVFDDRLTNHWPLRVLPISAEPPREVQTLIDEEYEQIRQLLAPGKRKRPDARAKIRALLAMEAHIAEGVVVSKRDVDRVERAIRKNAERERVFPRLSQLGTEVAGDGISVTVRFSKREGMPVRLVCADDEIEAAAIREVDLQRKYHWTKPKLAERFNLTLPRCLALRRYLDIEDDESCRHDFVFGSVTHRQYSDNAYMRIKEALEGGVDMAEVWRLCRPGGRGKPQALSAIPETAG